MASFRKRGTNWQAIVTLPDGKQFTRTDRLKKTVESWAKEVETEIRRGRWNDPRPAKNRTVTDWREQWLQGRILEPATRKKNDSHWRTRVQPRWGEAKLADVKRSAVQAWVAEMVADGVGAHSVAGAVNHFGAVLQGAVEHEPPLLASNPARGLDLPRTSRGRLRYFTHSEWEAIDAELAEPHRTLVELACFSGLRWGELAGLHGEAVDLARGEVHVRRVLTRDGLREYGKSERSHRTVPIRPHLVAALRPLVLASQEHSSRLVFVGQGRGEAEPRELDETNFRSRIWRAALERAGVEYAPPHTCRHTAASWLVQKGVPLTTVQALLGHESYSTTLRYAHLAPSAHDAVRAAWEEMAS